MMKIYRAFRHLVGNILRKLHLLPQPVQYEITVDQIPAILVESGPRLNFVISKLTNHRELVAELERNFTYAKSHNCPLRIITTKEHLDPAHYSELLQVHRLTPPVTVQFYDCTNPQQKLELSPEDIFYAGTKSVEKVVRLSTLQSYYYAPGLEKRHV